MGAVRETFAKTPERTPRRCPQTPWWSAFRGDWELVFLTA